MSGGSRSLTDVPEAEEESLTPTSPTPSSFNYPLTPTIPALHPPSITVSTSSSRSSSNSSSLKNRAPSIRTLGRTSSENMPGPSSAPTTPTIATTAPATTTTTATTSSSSTSTGTSSTSSNKRTSSSSSSSSSKTRTTRPPPPPLPASSTHLPIKFKSIPSLPHDKNAEPVPTTGMHWSRASVYGTIPQSTMRAHSVTLVDNIAWLFGGGNDDKDNGRDMKDMYCFDTETMQWTIRETTGDIPLPCRAHTATLVDRKLIIIGGGHGMQYYDKVYVLDTSTRHWTQPSISGSPSGSTPTPRRAHSAVLHQNKIWVFGGGTGLTALNDVWTLDISSFSRMKWEEIKTTGRTPKRRGYHTANLVGNYMVVMGGSDGKEFFTDTWCLDLNTRQWSQVSLLANKYKRIAHSATQVGSFLFIIGGYNGDEYCSDVLPFNLTSLSYEPRISYGRPPSGRAYHATILADSRLFLFGGFDGTTAYDDVYILDLSAGAYLPQVTSFSIEL